MTRLIGSVRPPRNSIFQIRSREYQLLIWLLIYVSNISDNWFRLLVLAQTEGYIKYNVFVYSCPEVRSPNVRTPIKLVIFIATPIPIANLPLTIFSKGGVSSGSIYRSIQVINMRAW